LLAKHIAPQKGRFAALCALLFTTIALQVINPQIMRYFIDEAAAGRDLQPLLLAALAFIGLAVAQQVIGLAATYVGENIAWTATNDLRAEIMGHVLSLDMGFHNSTSPGALIERIDGDVSELASFFSELVVRVLGSLLLLLGILAALALEDWRLGLAYGLLSTVALIVLARVKDLAVAPQKALRAANADLFGFLEERLGGMEDIRANGAVEFCLRGLYRLHAAIQPPWLRASQLGVVVRASGLLMMTTAQALAFVGSFYLFRAGLITLGTAYLVYYYSNLLYGPIRELGERVQSLQTVGASTARLAELRRLAPQVTDGPLDKLPSGALPVELRQVSFSYVPDEPVLDDISLRLVLGLLGRTGSGKTTLARLLVRLYDPTAGEVQLGGVDIRQVKVRAVREHVALVTQDVQLFQANVRDNLTFFNRSIPDKRIVAALQDLELGDWFRALPQGLDTQLGSEGQGLSAGEAQLLAFARVFLRDPGLVILDEASSRLDRLTEQRIERALDRLLDQRTAIIIAHRLGTVQRADWLLILEKGRPVEQGVRAQLAADPTSRFYRL
jgi:ATP-binding cassette subfamily B protein